MNLEHDIAWPSMARLSEETGLAKNTVRKYLDWLHDHGWLIKTRGGHAVTTAGGSQKSNTSAINLPEAVIHSIIASGINSLPDLSTDLSKRGGNSYATSAKGGGSASQGGGIVSPKGGEQLRPNNNRITIRNNNKENVTNVTQKPKTSVIHDWTAWGKENGHPPRVGESGFDYMKRLKAIE